MTHRFGICVLAFVVAVTATVSGQDNWFLDKPIKEIRFTGLESVSESELAGIVEPFVGKNVDNNLIIDLQSKVFALDYFEEFTLEAVAADDEQSAVILEFAVIERPVVGSIVLIGNRFIRRQDILDEILLKEGDMVTRARVRSDAEAIRSLYLERGFPDIDVSGSFERTNESQADVEFIIEEGAQRKVSELLFSGISFASPSTLKRVMATKEQSLFNTGVFQESNLAEDTLAIHTYYWDRGFVDAKVVDIVREVEPVEDGNNLIITYYVDEGVQYTYGGISFEGNELYSDERLLESMRQAEGSVLSLTKLEADFLRIDNTYATDGYIFNTRTIEENRDEANRIISYVVRIVERGRAHIENVILEGNEKTSDEVILRELPFESGDIFSNQSVGLGAQNLLNLQYFSSVIPDVVLGSVDGLVDVIFNFEEGRTTDINFGITFSGVAEGFPVIGFLKWTDANFRGRGQELSIGTNIAAFSQSLTFSFKENWLFGRRWSGGVELSAEHSRADTIQQDIIPPIFTGDEQNAVPDPYIGSWVWADGNAEGESAGSPFNGTTADLVSAIASGSVVTDYAYAISQGTSIDSDYLMVFDSYDLSLGLSTGYTFVFNAGRLGLGTRLSTTLSYVDYEQANQRPFEENIRENLGVWRPISTWLLNVTWDTRDIVYNPSKGIYLRQSATFTGGFLPSSRDFVKSSSKAQAFLTLFDVPVFDNWSFKGVLAANTSLSLILDPFIGDFSATTQELLYVDGMTVARGWPRIYDGRALFTNWIELRMPIVEQYIWADLFADGTGIWSALSDFGSMSIDDYLFGFGGGVRLTIPGLPIGLYLTKRFRFDDGAISWQGGNIFTRDGVSTSGLDLVISFSAEVF